MHVQVVECSLKNGHMTGMGTERIAIQSDVMRHENVLSKPCHILISHWHPGGGALPYEKRTYARISKGWLFQQKASPKGYIFQAKVSHKGYIFSAKHSHIGYIFSKNHSHKGYFSPKIAPAKGILTKIAPEKGLST